MSFIMFGDGPIVERPIIQVEFGVTGASLEKQYILIGMTVINIKFENSLRSFVKGFIDIQLFNGDFLSITISNISK